MSVCERKLYTLFVKEKMNGIFCNFIMLAFLVCFLPGIASATDKLSVCVSILPQKYFVQQIGKEMVDVQIMVQPGASPATYEPRPRQMADVAKSKIYFAIGVPFENVWLKKIAAGNPGIQIVHTERGIEKLAMKSHHHDDGKEDHNNTRHDQEHHRKVSLDPHIWLSPPLVKAQAHNILVALQENDPQNKKVYQANFTKFSEEIDRLDADLRAVFAGKQGLQFMVFHPAWGYFAHTYGLEQVPVEIEGKEPKPAQLKKLINYAREKGITMVFVQPQFSTKSAEVVAREIGGQVAFANPLAEDWMNNLREIADKFKAALK